MRLYFVFLICLPIIVKAGTLDEIIVTANRSNARTLLPAVELDRRQIQRRAPIALTDIVAGLPSVGVRTNSRGEAVIRIRGSEERQTALFLDGAPLNVPWDGRVDMSSLPADIVERAMVIHSAAPIEYGANAVLGVVDLSTRTSCEELCSARVERGEDGIQTYNLIGGKALQELSFVAAANYRVRDGEAVADSSSIPFAAISNGRRINTDNESVGFWGSVGYEGSRVDARVSQLFVDSSRGIAAAGHLDPASTNPRYWRYPDWRLSQTTLNSGVSATDRVKIRNTVWFQKFTQTIDRYADAAYSNMVEREEDRDTTLGARFAVYVDSEKFSYRLIGSFQQTEHQQVDTDITTGMRGGKKFFKQRLLSLGGELDFSPFEKVNISLGGSYDKSATPEAGGREPQRDLEDWAASLLSAWQVNDELTISSSIGRRTRFASLRELYGESLGTFLLNPGLQPETALLADISFDWQPDSLPFQLNVTPWVTRIQNALGRRQVGSKRQRWPWAIAFGQKNRCREPCPITHGDHNKTFTYRHNIVSIYMVCQVYQKSGNGVVVR